MAFPGSASSLPRLFQDSDSTQTETFTVPAGLTHVLGQGSPMNQPAGYQVVPPVGVTGAVSVVGPGSVTWTQVALGSTLGTNQYTVDYSTSATGGTLTFAAGNVGNSVSCSWIGSNLINEKTLGDLVTALKDIAAAQGAPNGLASLNGVGDLYIGRHIAPQASTPITASVAFSGGSFVASSFISTDVRGSLQINMGASPAAGALVTFTFITPYASAPLIIPIAGSLAARAAGIGVSSESVNGFTLSADNAPTANSVLGLGYLIVQ